MQLKITSNITQSKKYPKIVLRLSLLFVWLDVGSHKSLSSSKNGSWDCSCFVLWLLFADIWLVFWFTLICFWGSYISRLVWSSSAISCLRTLNIWSAVVSSVSELCCMISPIILLLIIMLSICWFKVYIEVAICTASNEFICWLIACDILPKMATVCSVFFIDFIRSHMISILAAVRWKLMAS